MENKNIISNFQTSSGYKTEFNDYPAKLICGNSGELTSGVASDYVTFDIDINETINELILYSSIFQATFGITIVDENGNTILFEEPYTATANEMVALEIHIALDAIEATKLTVVCYKGGNGGGNAGISAIATKER